MLKRPVGKKYRVSQKFGNKLYLNGKDIYGQWGLKGHNGIDYATPIGTPLYAAHDGIVKEKRYDTNGYGKYLKIESATQGSIYAHLSDRKVNINQRVEEGQLIGYTGNTGFSTAPHLHWGWYPVPRNRKNGYNGYEDQEPYIENEVDIMIRKFLVSKGYISPKAHLGVVKAMHKSDLDLKSGKYIIKTECEQQLRATENKLRREFKGETEKAVESAIKQAKKDCKDENEKQTKEIKEIKKSTVYKVVVFIKGLLKVLKIQALKIIKK